jgi:hypothetical protein
MSITAVGLLLPGEMMAGAVPDAPFESVTVSTAVNGPFLV